MPGIESFFQRQKKKSYASEAATDDMNAKHYIRENHNFYVIRKQGRVLGHILGTFSSGSVNQVNQISPIVKAVFDHAGVVADIDINRPDLSEIFSTMKKWRQQDNCSNTPYTLTQVQRNFFQSAYLFQCFDENSTQNDIPLLLLYFMSTIETLKKLGFDKPNLSDMLMTQAEASGKGIVHFTGDKHKSINLVKQLTGLELTREENMQVCNSLEKQGGFDPQKLYEKQCSEQKSYLAGKVETTDTGNTDEFLLGIEKKINLAISAYAETVLEEMISFINASKEKVFILMEMTHLIKFIDKLSTKGYELEMVNQTKKIYQVNLRKGLFTDIVQFDRIGAIAEPTTPECVIS